MAFWPSSSISQIKVDTSYNAEQLVKGVLAGSCINISNVSYVGSKHAVGYFDASRSNLGLSSGIVLSTGNVLDVTGPNLDSSKFTANNTVGDPDLTSLAGVNTYDAASLQFDFSAAYDTVYFRYVFGSEEYSEYVGQNFNDAFAFFVSGPGISGVKNVAMIPGTTIPVTINNINYRKNSTYYVDNNSGASVQFDGFTRVLQAKFAVQPCSTYHFKLVIADAGDYAYDSGVFLEARSFGGKTVQVVKRSNATENCSAGGFTLLRPAFAAQDSLAVKYFLSGTAKNGVDYKKLPGSITFPAGVKSLNLDIIPISDTLVEQTESVILTLDQNCTCTSSPKDSIQLFDNPLPRQVFGSQKSFSICRGETVQLNAAPGFRYKWTPSYGLSNDTISNPKAFPPVTTTYQVQVYNSSGCQETDSVFIDVKNKPVPSFIILNSCLNELTQFMDRSVVKGSAISSWFWNFGDGVTSTIQNPVHKYTQAGSYFAKLVITTTVGCRDSMVQRVDIGQPPVAKFATAGGCVNKSFVFTDISTSPGSAIRTWFWDLGNGVTSTVRSPRIIYSSPGRYKVSLQVTNLSGCSDSTSSYVDVFPEPRVQFMYSATCKDSEVIFRNTTINNGADIVRYLWDFGDGYFSTDESPVHKFSSAGSFSVKLSAFTSKGCIDTIKQPVIVNPKPKAGYVYWVACLDSPVVFYNTSKYVGSDTKYYWNFGDGTESFEVFPRHIFHSPGTYSVKLVISSPIGCRDSFSREIRMRALPHADFSFISACQDTSVKFSDKSFTDEGQISTWHWDFGDGKNSELANPAHSYSKPGTYNVSLTITTLFGCVSQVTKQVDVYELPSIDFEAVSNCYSANVLFKNQSAVKSSVITRYLWDFGDGTGSGDLSPSHLYLNPGMYVVRLTAMTDRGCVNALTKFVPVYASPKASFDNFNSCQDTSVTFVDKSTISFENINSWEWDFGDGYRATGIRVNHYYRLPGDYKVVLKVTSVRGCTDTISKLIYVNTRPKAFADYKEVCFGDPMLFVDKSTVDHGSIIEWNWDFGDGSISSDRNPIHKYSAPGDYDLKLVVVSDKYCSDTFQAKVRVHAEPRLKILTSPVCLHQPTVFQNLSSIRLDSVTEWRWDFGDGYQSTEMNPVHIYSTPGKYSVSVSARTNAGCMSLGEVFAEVYALPKADFSIVPGKVNLLEPFVTFKDSSKNGVSCSWSINGNLYTSTTFTYEFRDTGSYPVSLVVKNANGCSDTLIRSVVVDPAYRISIPNAFTPNNDGNNDGWVCKSIGARSMKTRVWNKWGEMVFESNAMNPVWDGTYSFGGNAPEGIYYYVVVVKDYKKETFYYEGNVLLFRQ